MTSSIRPFIQSQFSKSINSNHSFNHNSPKGPLSLSFSSPGVVPRACLNLDGRSTDSSLSKQAHGKSFGKSSEIMEQEKKLLVGTYARAPLVLSDGKGCKLYDIDGREYLDLSSGIAVNALGHGDPDWLWAVIEQANKLTHVSNIYYSVPQV